VLVLVLLPALAGALGSESAAVLAASVSGGSILLAVLVTIGKVTVLGVLMLVVGSRFVPWLLVQVARLGSRELFTLAVLGIALGIAYASSVIFGVSLALGAFLAGAVVSESDMSHQAASDALPLRDAFAVLFFVSVRYAVRSLNLAGRAGVGAGRSAIILIGKPLAAMAIVLLLATRCAARSPWPPVWHRWV
jgi:CPA2 family monovalent cation:H+ antiporter-2